MLATVLVVAQAARGPYQRPMLATALDDASARSLELARRIAGTSLKSGTLVHAYHVPLSGFVAPSASSRERAEWQAEFRAKAEASLHKFVARHLASDKRWSAATRMGDPRAVIASEAERRRADVLVLSTHARSGIAHLLLGSVAERLLAEVSCDVLIARPVRFSFELP